MIIYLYICFRNVRRICLTWKFTLTLVGMFQQSSINLYDIHHLSVYPTWYTLLSSSCVKVILVVSNILHPSPTKFCTSHGIIFLKFAQYCPLVPNFNCFVHSHFYINRNVQTQNVFSKLMWCFPFKTQLKVWIQMENYSKTWDAKNLLCFCIQVFGSSTNNGLKGQERKCKFVKGN